MRASPIFWIRSSWNLPAYYHDGSDRHKVAQTLCGKQRHRNTTVGSRIVSDKSAAVDCHATDNVTGVVHITERALVPAFHLAIYGKCSRWCYSSTSPSICGEPFPAPGRDRQDVVDISIPIDSVE